MSETEEYEVTLLGPDGYCDFVAHSQEDALDLAGDLLSASNGYHDVKIAQKHIE